MLVALAVGLLVVGGCERNMLEHSDVTVQGEVGVRPQVQLNVPIDITANAAEELVSGDGYVLAEHDPALIRYVAFDADTGDTIEDSYPRPPLLMGVTEDDAGALYDDLLGSAEGSRLLIRELGSTDDARNKIIVLDILHTRAHGEEVATAPGLPQVSLAPDGQPTVDLAGVDLSDLEELKVVPTIRGTGAQIREGDIVTLRYSAVDGITGEETESTWGEGSLPTSTPFTGLIPGWQQGLADTTVGSQVMLIVPPELAYGTNVMIFVVDVLAVTAGGN